MVSHDFVEIYKLSNRIITLNSGKIIEDTTPQDISLKDNLLLDGVVLDIIEQDGKSFYLISVLNQIVKIESGDRKIEAGERVKLSSNSLAIDLGGSYV
jgi:ABC-type sulfate/molybdate transport systems ATPase subunit